MNIYKRHRFPPDVIGYAGWLYHRFNLSHRDIEDLLAERAYFGQPRVDSALVYQVWACICQAAEGKAPGFRRYVLRR